MDTGVLYEKVLNEDDFYAGGVRPPGQGPRGTRYVTTCFNLAALGCFDANDVKYSIQGREVCPTTNRPHLQCYVWFKEKIRLTALFTKYPLCRNWQIAKGSPWQNFVYCSKDGDFVEQGTRPKEPKEKDTTFSEALAADTVEEGIELVQKGRPRDFCLHGESIRRNLIASKKVKFTHKFTQFTIPFRDITKPLLIWGDAGSGKTAYSLAHFVNPLMIRHMDQLRGVNLAQYDGLVFDDLSFKHRPVEDVIHMLDYEYDTTIHVRYGTATIPAGMKRIFTHNSANPFYMDGTNEEQIAAIERRFVRIHIVDRIY